MNDIKLSQLALDTNLKPVPIKGKPVTQEQYYKATFSPAFPYIENFQPNQFLYQSFTKETMSIIGRYHVGDVFYQIGFVLPYNFQTKIYDIEDWGDGKVSSNVVANGAISAGKNGKIDITREGKTVRASFHFEIDRGGVVYEVQNGKFSLVETGGL
ncbi:MULTISPECIES: hypothetical protein [Pseudomonas]|uniref:hypothetical protein n=1 Tax=Pseudomonas TaxID=286 RepID=UPI00215D17E6|nr:MULTISPECIES: hypothetical protein [unclassified Pseudomonas]MCR8931686.1 hypothetical protein [Pseudomonas sp. S11A4]MCR8975295.1 hypothetical protein [Pseudomonas sp. S11P7]